MEKRSSASLCRICLVDGATLPIFEDREKEDSIYLKLCICLNDKIADVATYPRNICHLCHTKLDTVYIFVNTYKNSCKLLETGLPFILKQEIVELDDSCNDKSENDIIDLHIQPKIEFDNAEDFIKSVAPFKLKLNKVKKELINKTKCETAAKKRIRLRNRIEEERKPRNRIKKVNKPTNGINSKNKTNRIASSLLEGDFIWNGEYWSLNSSKTKSTVLKKEVDSNQERPTKTTKLEKVYIKERQNQETSVKTLKPTIDKIPKSPEKRLCDLCGQIFSNQYKLSLHKNRIHTTQQSITCPTCSKVLSSDYSLKKHIKRLHIESEKIFICSACGHRYAYKGEMMMHYKKVHEKELYQKPKKEYSCKICNKQYACGKSVLIHERSVHTGERPAVCSVCGSSFYHEDYLKEHMRLHTGETPFKCPVCGRGYAQRCNMKSHIKQHRRSELDPITLSKIRPNFLRLMKA